MTVPKLVQQMLSLQAFRLKQATTEWEMMIDRIRDNPNQMNVNGLWQRDQLTNLATLRVIILERQRVIADLREDVARFVADEQLAQKKRRKATKKRDPAAVRRRTQSRLNLRALGHDA